MQSRSDAASAPAASTCSDGNGPKRLKPKHSLAIRWFHWMNFPVLMAMIWSGLLIYWANDIYRVGWASTTLFQFFPPGFYERFHIGQRLAEAWPGISR